MSGPPTVLPERSVGAHPATSIAAPILTARAKPTFASHGRPVMNVRRPVTALLYRDLAERGHHVTAVDSSPTLVTYARALDSRAEYVVADAAALPFPDATFACVVAYNSLMDVADMPKAVARSITRPD